MRRHVAPALAGLCLAGLATLAAVPAAAFTGESGPTVTFNGGGDGVLSCQSVPDRGSVSTTAGTAINVVNQTGHTSTLYIGQTEIPFANGQGKGLVLKPGRYELQMKPSCPLNLSEAGSVGVEVASPRPTKPAKSTGTGGSAANPKPAAQPSGNSGSTRNSGTRITPPPTPAPSVPATPTETPTEPGVLPGTTPDPMATEGPSDVVAVQPFIPTGLNTPPRANRLLALVATICIVGVTIAAIRAIISQRAGRTAVA